QNWLDWNILSVGRCQPSPDGKIVATWVRVDRTVRLWDAATGKQFRLLGKHQWESDKSDGPIRAVVFSPDGKLLATADDNPSVRLWDVARGTELRQFRGLHGETGYIAFAPDGKTLAAWGVGKEVRLCDVTTGR